MTKTPELDRAIEAADNAYCNHIGLPTHEFEVGEAGRTYARALVAELLRGLDEPPLDPPAILGWDLAIQIIKRRAGLEGEG